MTEEEARAAIDKVIDSLDEAFGDDTCTIVICLTESQERIRYASNMEREVACEVMRDLMDNFEDEDKRPLLN